MDQIRWIEQWPLLERLDWKVPWDKTSSDAIMGLVQSLKRGACPRLTQLILDARQECDTSFFQELLALLETVQHPLASWAIYLENGGGDAVGTFCNTARAHHR